jgi:hypothetical protein
MEVPAVSITEPSDDRKSHRFLLTPLDRQPQTNLIVCLFLAAIGLRLRPELRLDGQTDADAIRAELRRREWAVRS